MQDRSKSTQLPIPKRRPLRAFAFDPSRQNVLGNKMTIEVRNRTLRPGPVEVVPAYDRVAVVDYDASRDKYYLPVDLDDPSVLMQSGIAPSEADPRFHQQMVYAIVSDTIEQFESALGRRIHWHRAERKLDSPRGWLPEDIVTLTLFPHAMEQANAYYSPDAHGILFGYFQASRDDPGHNLPGQAVFTCLSHDIIVHETTHAILDGMRSHFMEATNVDVAAFHEAFADLVALFRHFSHREVLVDVVRRTGGRLYPSALNGDALADQASGSFLGAGEQDRNPLIELAGQFGEAIGMRSALRSAIGKRKTMKELRDTGECHERGSILVAAVFDAFFTIYLQRAEQYLDIFRAAGGSGRGDLPAPLVDALCDVAARTASDFFRACVRAVDYLPPVDVRFGDFLRAVMTSERDFDPTDQEGIRDAWMQAFRTRGILPDDAPFFSEDALCWPARTEEFLVPGLPFGGPSGLSHLEQKQTAAVLEDFIRKDEHRELLGLDPELDFAIPSFHPLYRTSLDGRVRWDLVVEVVQTDSRVEFPMRGGTTMIISTHSTGGSGGGAVPFLRYVISKPLGGQQGALRQARQAAFLQERGVQPDQSPSSLRVNFALLHGEGVIMVKAKATNPSAPWEIKAGEVGIRVRMYRVGFGDFFLVTFLDDQQNQTHIVIDCGVFKGTSQTGDIGSLAAAVANMMAATDKSVALIVMTHRHADHIAGFGRFESAFKELKVGAVWMPIWESEYEPTAAKFQLELTRTALGLQQHFASFGAAASKAQRSALSFLENATGSDAGALAGARSLNAAATAAPNAKALNVLKGFKDAPPEYYKAGDVPKLPKALKEAGLTCQVLGPPPVEDLDLMKLMDLQKGVGQYLTSEGEEPREAFSPFGEEWEVSPVADPSQGITTPYTSESFREWRQLGDRSGAALVDEEASRREMESGLRQSLPVAALTAAKKLNAFLNNQSLVALFTFKGKKLLFVGDAQAGNWVHWLFETDTPDKVGTATPSKRAQQILTSLDFYKVGHHGSGNATPKIAATWMGRGHGFACMCSTEDGVYGTENPDDETKGTEVPRVPLLEELASEGALVRSDQFDIKFTADGKEVRLAAAVPGHLPPTPEGCRFVSGPIWVDCFL